MWWLGSSCCATALGLLFVAPAWCGAVRKTAATTGFEHRQGKRGVLNGRLPRPSQSPTPYRTPLAAWSCARPASPAFPRSSRLSRQKLLARAACTEAHETRTPENSQSTTFASSAPAAGRHHCLSSKTSPRTPARRCPFWELQSKTGTERQRHSPATSTTQGPTGQPLLTCALRRLGGVFSCAAGAERGGTARAQFAHPRAATHTATTRTDTLTHAATAPVDVGK